MNTRLNLKLVSTVTVLMASFLQGCGQQAFQTKTAGSESSASTATFDSSKIECKFVGPSILESRLKSALGISAGDISALDDNGNATNEMRIAKNREVLGAGNSATGKADDFTCATTKFKVSVEVMVDACAVGLADTKVKSDLFPSGLSNFDALYKAFVGRVPTSYESQVIKEAIAGVPSGKAEAAACAVVATSLESLIRI